MKQLVLDLTSGKTKIIEAPDPVLRSGGVIVRNACSVISLGTERTLMNFAKKNLIGKAKERPDLFKAFLEKAKRDGFIIAVHQAKKRLEKYFPLGYSSSGIVTEVADDVTEFKIGDRVACAGAEFAWHAEKIFVPKNMVVKIPNEVEFKDASFTTIASIGLNGLRCIHPEVGETIVIIGLGLIGLLTAQIAKASGCHVIGIDIDIRKTELAKDLGIDVSLVRNEENEITIKGLTNGFGSDAVIITASSNDNDSVQLAGKIVRKKGRVSIVGAVKLDIPREDYYLKEISVIIPSSYGPGRYDRKYEELGQDYPIEFVRWTISRNMTTVLDLMKEKKVLPSKLITQTISIEDTPQTYNVLENMSKLTIGSLITYPIDEAIEESKLIIKKYENEIKGKINCGFIGAGIYATSTILPIISQINDLSINAVSTLDGINSSSVADKYKIKKIYSDYHSLIEDKNIDLIFALTRNSTHCEIVLESLRNGKNVFVEKPLAINLKDIQKIEEEWKNSNKTIFVGFNRRYSSFTNEIKNNFKNRVMPMIAFYRVNAEQIPENHWIYDEKEGGGRIISESCHFIDYLNYVIASKPVQVFATTIKSNKKNDILDNFIITINFEDGSIGSVIYTSKGSKKFSKERVEFFADNMTAVIDNFRTLNIMGDKKNISKKYFFSQDKGHKNEINYLVENIKNGNKLDKDFEISLSSSKVTIAALKSIISGKVECV